MNNLWSHVKFSSSVIRQKGESQNGYFKKTKHVKFSEKLIFLTPWYVLLIRTRMCTYQVVTNVRFSQKFGMLCFLQTPVLRFALMLYYRRYIPNIWIGNVAGVNIKSTTMKQMNIGCLFGGVFILRWLIENKVEL